jgi:hypothetical protein
MSEIINYVIIIISSIMDVFYNIHITAECVISIGYWVALFILVLIINSKNILKKLLYIIYIIMTCISFILINITSAGEDCNDIIYPLDNTMHDYITYSDDMSNYIWDYNNISNYSNNVMYMIGNEGWELYYPSGESGYIDLLIADRNIVNSVFTSNIPELQNQRITKYDLYITFKDTIETNSMKSWYKLDKTKYTKQGVLDSANFEYLYRGIISTKSSNNQLDLKWWNLCYLYGITHHNDIPFDINDIKSYTPESFYNHLVTKKENNSLNDYWKRELVKYEGNKKGEFYAYMRIIHFVINRRNQ